ncbi:MAG: hypothetical protein QOE56_31 [Solirubrobacterales bacterium]|jgi:hypothetical protein|nr:hypothetical protein [Solirubrobacterales bacterium]
MAHRLLAIVPDEIEGPEPLAELGGHARNGGVELRIVVPAVEANAFQHTLGDIDGPKREAEARLDRVMGTLRRQGIPATGEVGDPDPVQAAQDALLKAPADEVLIFEREDGQSRWFEEGLFDRAQAGLEPPLRLVVLHGDGDGQGHVVDTERASRGTVDPGADKEIGSAYLPGLSRGDFAGMVIGVVGTIITIVLAAIVTADGSSKTGPEAAAILIAIGIALINMAHVVGLTLMESVRYRGGFAKFFRDLALIGTPIAVIANLVLVVAT